MLGIVRKLVRFLAVAALLLFGVAWAWSYHKPAGIFGIDDEACSAAHSTNGSIVISRLRGKFLTRYPVMRGWRFFHESGWASDQALLADGWINHRHQLGFAFVFERPPGPPDHVWELREDGLPFETTQPVERPPLKNHEFVFITPWWFICLATLGLTCLAWHRTKPKFAGFPISPKST